MILRPVVRAVPDPDHDKFLVHPQSQKRLCLLYVRLPEAGPQGVRLQGSLLIGLNLMESLEPPELLNCISTAHMGADERSTCTTKPESKGSLNVGTDFELTDSVTPNWRNPSPRSRQLEIGGCGLRPSRIYDWTWYPYPHLSKPTTLSFLATNLVVATSSPHPVPPWPFSAASEASASIGSSRSCAVPPS